MSQKPQLQSPVKAALEPLDPKWTQIQGMVTALSFRSSAIESASRATLALCDVSCLARVSFKGPDAVRWLKRLGILVPETVYEYSVWSDGGLIIRTDGQEVLLEDGPEGCGVAGVREQYGPDCSGVYRLERQEAEFVLCGAQANNVFLETCGYDFRQPGNRLVMTRVAGVSCAVLPTESAGVPTFRLWLDCSYSVYLWEALDEIVRDHGGDVIGIGSVFPELLAKG